MNNFVNVFMKKINENCFAHQKQNKEIVLEELIDHSFLCLKYHQYFKETIGQNIFDSIYDSTSSSLLESMILLHDTGKKNPKFQHDIMNNKSVKCDRISNSNHSLLSSYIYIKLMFDIYVEKFIEEDDNYHLREIVINAFLISRHHSNLEPSFKEFLEQIKAMNDDSIFLSHLKEYDILPLSEIETNYGTYLEILESVIEDNFINHNSELNDNESIELYIKTRLSYSLLVNCDSMATREFLTNEKFEIYEKLNIHRYFDGHLYSLINDYRNCKKVYNNDDINKLRSDIAIEVEESISNSNNNIMFLESPCGSGKTNLSILSACKLIDKNNSLRGMIYTAPFNSIADQNAEVYKEYYPDTQVINSTSLINNVEYKEHEIEKMINDYQIGNFSSIITSHVHLFNILFGTTRHDLLNLLILTNRVVIIDEIQAYKPNVWKFMIKMFDVYSRMLNIKFIIMSATLPDFALLVNDVKIDYLLKNKDYYFSHPLFKDRVYFECIGSINNLELLIKEEAFYDNKKVLYEFINKKTANKFYTLLKQKYPKREIYLLDGDCNSFVRKEIINKSQILNEIILVCTQVIEAGVDIDFDYGLKDISLYDSEIQFLGRINRSCKKKGYAEFFSYDTKRIYAQDVRIENNIFNKEIFDAIKNNDNHLLYSKTIDLLNRLSNYHSGSYSYSEFTTDCYLLKFKNIFEKMELIAPNANIYLASNLLLKDIFNSYFSSDFEKKNRESIIQIYEIVKEYEKKYGLKIFTVTNNDLSISGKMLWDLSVLISKNINISYAEKFLENKNIEILKQFFLFTIYKNSLPKDIEKINNFLYYSENPIYYIDGKINRDAMQKP